MNARELILQAIKPDPQRRRDRQPVALLSGGTWAFRQRQQTLRNVLDGLPQTAAQHIVEVNRLIASDIVWPGSGYHNLLVHVLGGRVKFRPQGNIDVIEPLLTDLPAMDALDLDRIDRHEWIVAIREIIAAVAGEIGQDYLIGTSSWGPFTLAGQFYGVERLMSGLYKDKQAVHNLLAWATEVCVRYLAPAIARGAAILSIAEPTASGDLISLRHFEEFVVPYLAKTVSRLKQENALITLHICGNIGDRLHIAPELGVDLLSVDYKVDLQQAQQILNGRIALAGNVNPVLLKDGTGEDIAATAGRCLQAAAADNFILMPGCDIPPAVPLGNVIAFMNAGRQWQP